MTYIPTATVRASGCVAGAAVYVEIGRRIYKGVALTKGVWSSFTQVADLGSGIKSNKCGGVVDLASRLAVPTEQVMKLLRIT